MKKIGLLLVVGAVLSSGVAFADADALDRQELVVTGVHPEAKLMNVMGDLKSILLRFRPVLQKGTTLLSGPSVSGSMQHPVLQMSVEKCVLVICKKVRLDAEVSMREIGGSCDRNLVIEADLERSGSPLADTYRSLVLKICYRNESATQGRLVVNASAVRADSYSAGTIQKAITQSLTLQIQGLVKALDRSLQQQAD